MISFQPDHTVRPLHSPHVAASPENSNKDCAYFGNNVSQGTANGYHPFGSVYQERFHGRSQECGILDASQARSEPLAPPRRLSPDPFTQYGSNTDWKPKTTQMSASFNDAPSFPNPGASTTCPNCRNYPPIAGISGYNRDQSQANAIMDRRSQGAVDTEDNVQSDQQLFTRRPNAPLHDPLDVPHLEPPKYRSSPRKSAGANSPKNPVTVHADRNGDCASSGPVRKRTRKPRTNKPRKPRTLTDEGKAHAKAVRESPGGACADCKIKKTKARSPTVTNLVNNKLITDLVYPQATRGYSHGIA